MSHRLPQLAPAAMGALALLLVSCSSGPNVRDVERSGLVHLNSAALTIQGRVLRRGDRSPDFLAVDDGFRPVRLHDLAGRIVVISAVPSLDTQICSAQTARFETELAQWPDDVVAVTISTDLPFAQQRVCKANGIKAMRVWSDAVHHDFGYQFGVRIRDRGLLARSVWVIDRDQRIAYREIVPELTRHPDYNAAVAAVNALLTP